MLPNGTGKEQAADFTKDVSLNTLFDVLRKHRLCVIVTPLLVTIAVVIYVLQQPTRYRAETLLAAEPTTVEGYVNAQGNPPPINVQEKLWLVRENLLSPTVLEPLIQDFHLENRKDAESQFQLLAERTLQRLPFFKIGDKPSAVTPQNQGEPSIEELKKIEDLEKRITIQVEAADAFSVGFEGDDRKQATDVANRLADVLIMRTSAARQQNATWAADFLKDEVERVKQKLDSQNEQIRSYQQRTASELPTRLASDLKFQEDLQEQLHAKSDQLSNEQARHTAILQEIRDLESRGTSETLDKSEDETKLEALRAKLKQLQTTYTDQHPEIRQVRTEIRDLEKSIAENKGKPANRKPGGEPSPAQLRYMELKAEQQASEQRLSSFQKQEKDLAGEMQSYRQKAEAAPESERTLAMLAKDYDATRTEYQSILQKQEQAQLDERLNKLNQGSVFRIVRRAFAPLTPSGPHRVRISLMGLAAGLCLGVGLAFVAELRDTSYENADEFQNAFNLPILSVIPAISFNNHSRRHQVKQPATLSLKVGASQSEQKALAKEAVITVHDPKSIAAEQYGILAMEARQRLGRDSSRVLAVTSPAGGEGKTITSLNLSIALSRTMEGKVLLVECDLRKPRLHEYLSFRPGKGFSDLLQNPDEPIDPYIWRLNGLSFIPGGRILEDPLRFLSSPGTPGIFARLREKFQFIVVDTPPIVPIADSHILCGLADGVVLVVRARQTRRELLKHALQSFHAPNILGVVLNSVDLRQSRYYYAYDYYAEQYIGGENRKRA
jgi:succinoglycan biosynthesis transport protein ExoP